MALTGTASDIKLNKIVSFCLCLGTKEKNTKRNNKYIDKKKYKQSKTNERKVLKGKIKLSYKKLYVFLARHEYNNGSHES